MTETVAIDRPAVAKPVSRPRSRKPATVSASALALHLDCSRADIGKLEAEGLHQCRALCLHGSLCSAIQRQGYGFPLDQSRVAYLRYLRREKRQSPRANTRRPALDALHQPVDAVLRIAADKQMDVVWHDFHFNQRRLRLVAYLPN